MIKAARWMFTAVAFAAFYAKELLISNLRVARDVLSPRPPLAPGIVRVPVSDMTDRQIFFYGALLTMTPGTLTLDVDPDARCLYLHTLYALPSPEALRASLKEHYEKPIRRLF
jgi:multicomponent Na+:H+ antiporter subunit E